MSFRLLTVALGLAAITAPIAAQSDVSIGEVVGDDVFYLSNGQRLSVRDLRGQVTVLMYWASDCKPCDAQIRVLDAYARQRRGVGLVTLVASADEGAEKELRNALAGTTLHGVSSVRGQLGPMTGVPTFYMIDRFGQVRYAATGTLDTANLDRVLLPWLRQAQPKDM